MYKAVECPCCSKKVSIPVSFLGSGHDSWDKTHTWMRNSDIAFRKPKRKIKELEAKIKILSEKTYNKFN